MCFARYGQEILQNEIHKILLTQALEKKGLQITQAELRSEIVRAAMERGYARQDGTPDVESWLKYLGHEGKDVEFYIQDQVWPTVALKKLVTAKAVVTDQEVVEAYESKYGPRASVLAVILNDQRTAMKVWNLASTNPTEEFFGKLAHQYSVEPASRFNDGVIPPIQAHAVSPKMTRAAFALDKNEISPVIEIDNKWVILFGKGLLVDHAWEVSFDSVKKELREQVFEKKLRKLMHQEFEQLKSDATINRIISPSRSIKDHSDEEANSETITLKVFAETSGVVEKVPVSNGQSVTQDQLVIALRNQALDLQLQELEQNIDPADDKQAGELSKKLELAKEKQATLQVVAPVQGKILDVCAGPGQPVAAGQLLLTLEVERQPGLKHLSQQNDFRKLQSDFFQERVTIERMVKTNPRVALERMRELRMSVSQSNVNQAGKDALMAVVSRDIAGIEGYIAKAKPDGEHFLRYRMNKGDQIRWIADQSTHSVVSINDKTEKAVSSNRSVLLWSVVDVNSDGNILLVQSVESTNITSKVNDEERITYNSTTNAKPPAEFEKLANIIGKTTQTITIDSRGNVVECSEDFNKQDFANLFPPLPEHPLKIGDEWTTPFQLDFMVENQNKSLNAVARYRLESVKEGTARIVVECGQLANPEFRMQTVQQIPSGTIDFDVSLGLPIRRAIRTDETINSGNTKLAYVSSRSYILALNTTQQEAAKQIQTRTDDSVVV